MHDLHDIERILRLHSFKPVSDSVWIRGRRNSSRRFAARIDVAARTVEFSGKRATATAGFADDVEAVMRRVLDA